jgi:ABC-type sugar transport system, permease component
MVKRIDEKDEQGRRVDPPSDAGSFEHTDGRARLGDLVSALVLAGLAIPPAIVPTIFVLQSTGLYKTLIGLILVEVAFLLPFSVLIFRAFVASIPRELDEAAIMDGAGPVQLFLKVIFPLLRPAIITVIVVGSVFLYNDFVNPLYSFLAMTT